jgi:hypothetical protein
MQTEFLKTNQILTKDKTQEGLKKISVNDKV